MVRVLARRGLPSVAVINSGACTSGALHLTAYREVMGDGHPFTLACEVNVAIVMRLGGKLDEARALNGLAMTALTAALGADHPYTMCAANCEATT